MKKIRLIMKSMLCGLVIVGLLFIKNIKHIKADEELIKYAKSAILIEVETGTVLYEYNAHERYEPASMTKIMTMKLVLDALASKRIEKNQMLSTSENAKSKGGTQIFLEVGEKMKVEDLFKAMVIASANDAATTLAEGISGSEQFFVSQMNAEVKKLGLKNTHFSNVTGLPTENHYSSSYDMAMIARNLLVKYEDEIIPYTSRYEDYVREDSDKPFWLVNTNKLIKHAEGVDGLKTGWTESAGYCLTCTKRQDGMRLISVVMNADTIIHRSEDTLSLLNYGFATYEKMVIVPENTEVKKDKNILLDPSTYNIITSNSVVKIIKKNTKLNNPRIEIEYDIERINSLHQYNIGKMKVYVDNELIGEASLELEKTPKKNSFINVLRLIIKQIF